MNYKKQYFNLKNKRIIFFLVGWKSKIWEYYFVVLILLLNRYDCIIYEYGDEILTPNIEKTISSFNLITDDVLRTIDKMKTKKYESFAIFGTSLGTVLSLIVANRTKSINKIILNLTSSSLAKTTWSWDSLNNEFKQNLINNGVTLKSLEKSWRMLAPINNLENIGDRQILIYLAEKDEVIPYAYGLELIQKIKKNKINYELVVNNKNGHLFNGLANLLKYNKYINFLRKL